MENTPSSKQTPSWKQIIVMYVLGLIIAFFLGNKRFDNPIFIFMAGSLAIPLIARWLSNITKKWPVIYGVIGILFSVLMGWMNWQKNPGQPISKLISEITFMLFIFTVIPGVCWGLFALVKNFAPYEANVEHQQEPEMSQNEYQKWYGLNALLYVASAIATGFLVFYFLREFSRWYFAHLLNGLYVITVDTAVWSLAATFLGIMLGAIPGSILMRLILKGKYEQMLQIETRNTGSATGINNQKLLAPIFVLTILIAFGIIYAGLTTYTRFTEIEVAIQRPQYWLSEKTYAYQEIIAIQQIAQEHSKTSKNSPKKKIGVTRFYRIRFSDGTEWESDTFDDKEPIPTYYQEIFGFVSQKSNHEIEQITEQK